MRQKETYGSPANKIDCVQIWNGRLFSTRQFAAG